MGKSFHSLKSVIVNARDRQHNFQLFAAVKKLKSELSKVEGMNAHRKYLLTCLLSDNLFTVSWKKEKTKLFSAD